MTDIRDTLSKMKEKDRETFLNLRTAMRRCYLSCIAATVGIRAYKPEDDNFMDAMDIKLQMLLHRAGMSTDSEQVNQDSEFDPFALITRPQHIMKLGDGNGAEAPAIRPRQQINETKEEMKNWG